MWGLREGNQPCLTLRWAADVTDAILGSSIGLSTTFTRVSPKAQNSNAMHISTTKKPRFGKTYGITGYSRYTKLSTEDLFCPGEDMSIDTRAARVCARPYT
ncbi:uncharacterized protein DFL_002525 [Arthrobotrys flagrans]|uniref:Uncharacterized protein n=1 Tax=Arthrobotrys flagrans TaxID=97331 RepID=A0A437AB61_ARTFL|nr:hypothetical protein DFL_002525 [Arthrobotrys flagrans]